MLIPKPPHGSIEWLRLRHRDETGWPVVSASDAAAVHDQHRFKTRVALAMEKLADEPTVTEPTEAMQRGNRLEPVIIDWLTDVLGQKIEVPDMMYRYDDDGVVAVATLDGVVGPIGHPDAIIEVKTYNRRFDPDANLEGYGPLPAYWYWQGVQQSLCTGVDTIIWGVFDSQLRLQTYTQTVTDAERAGHVSAIRAFSQQVAAGSVPTDWPATYADVAGMVANPEETCDVDDIVEVIDALGRLQEQRRIIEAREEELKGQIGLRLGSAVVGTVAGRPVVTWRAASRSSFDQKRFAQDHPALAADYTRRSTYRTMRITKGEE